jgi:hypothetical protein
METKKQTRRSSEEIIQEKVEQIARLQAKKVIDEAKNNELLTPIVTALTNARNTYTKAAHGFSSGPQSHANRLHSYKLKTIEVEAEMALQEAIRDRSQFEKEFLTKLLNEASTLIAQGKEDEVVALYIEDNLLTFNEENSNDFSDLVNAHQEAVSVRKEFTSTRKIK